MSKKLGSASQKLTSIFSISLIQASAITSLTLGLLFYWKLEVLLLLTDLPEILIAIDHYFFWLALVMVCAISAFIMDGIFIGITRSKEKF